MSPMNAASSDLPLRESVRAIFPKPNENRIEEPLPLRGKADSPENDVDSGYASRNSNSPKDFESGGPLTPRKSEASNDESTPCPSDRAGLNILRGILFPRKKRLMAFPEKEIPNEVYRQFQNVTELVKRRLADALYQSKSLSSPVVIKLINLGDDEPTARPFIVIICDKSAGAKARQLIKESWYKEHCRDREGKRPPLETVVYDQEGGPKFRNLDKLSIYLPSPSCQATNFGRLLRFQDGLEEHMVTLGGIVLVRKTFEEDRIYALTAGHHLYRPAEDDETLQPSLVESATLEPSGDDNLEIEDFCSDAEVEYEIAWDEPDNMRAERDRSASGESLTIAKDLPTGGHGKIVTSSYEADAITPNLDWALVELEPRAECLSIVREFYWKVSHLIDADQSKAESKKHSTSSTLTKILVFAGRTGIHSGILSRESSLFLAPGSREFVEVYTIRDLDAPLEDGDSGAWVVDKATKGVHGQFIASGPFAEYYVILLPLVERCIARQLHADFVSVASEEEVKKWLEEYEEDAKIKQAPPSRRSQNRHVENLASKRGWSLADFTLPGQSRTAESLYYAHSKLTPSTSPLDSGYVSKESSRRTSPRTSS